MTAATIARAAQDPQLRERVLAMVMKELLYTDELANSEYGKMLRAGNWNVSPLMYPVAVDTEAAYAAALQADRGAPGYDIDIITDGALTSSIVANWPWTDAERPVIHGIDDFEAIGPHGPDDVPVLDNTLPEPES